MERFFDLTELGIRSLLRQKARTLAATMAIAVAVFGVILVAGHALHRRNAIHDLMLMMVDATLLKVRAPSQIEGDARRGLQRDHLEMDDAEALRAIPGVSKVGVSLTFAAEAKYGREVSDVTVVGCGGDWFELLGYQVAKGRQLHTRSDTPECLLTQGAVQLLLGGEEAVGEELRLNGYRVKAVGIAKPQSRSNAAICFVGLATATAIGRIAHPTGLALRVADASEVPQVRRAAEDVLSRLLGKGIGKEVVSSDTDLFGGKWARLGKDVLAEAVFLMLGLLIATATVAELLYAGVQADLAEMGTLRSLGATRSDIAWQITAQALCVCLVGGGLGLLLAQSYYFWPQYLQGQFRWISSPQLSVVAVVLSLGSGVFASLLPAWSAVQGEPVVAMKEPGR